jgi:hypothetical protein
LYFESCIEEAAILVEGLGGNGNTEPSSGVCAAAIPSQSPNQQNAIPLISRK